MVSSLLGILTLFSPVRAMRGSNHQQFVRWIIRERSLEGKSSSRSNFKLVMIVHASIPSLDIIARHLPPPHTHQKKREAGHQMGVM